MQPWGSILENSLKGYSEQHFWNPHQGGGVNCVLPTSTRPQTWWNQKVADADSHLPHHQPIRRLPVSWPRPLWIIIIKTPYPSRLGHSFEGSGPLWPPLTDKATKLLFFLLCPQLCLQDLVRSPGGLPSMGSHRVGHDWSGLAAAAAAGWRDLIWL